MKRSFTLCLSLVIFVAACAPVSRPASTTQPQATSAPWTTTPTIAPLLESTGTPISAVTATPTLSPALDELVPFYRLRIEYSTSSDWTTLEMLNPDNILAARQISPLNTHTRVRVEISLLSLEQSLSAAETNNRVGVTVDYAVSPEALDVPLNFLLQKGALNNSTVRIYNVIGDTLSLLLDVEHQGEVIGNTDNNPLAFSLDLSRLKEVPPLLAPTGQPEVPPMVWAFYYPWYSLTEWDSDQLVDRPATRYASSDPQAIARHIEQAQAAGIDGFVCSWWGPGSETDQNLGTLLDLAAERDFRVAIYFETLDNEVARMETDIFAWLAYVIRTYGDHPAYMRVDGKPLIVLWATEAVPTVHWVIVSNAVYLQGLEVVLLGMGYTATNLELFDGFHDYGVFTYPNLALTDMQAARLARYFPLLMDVPAPKIFAATVQPGYDDHLLPDRGGGQIVDRLEGDFYRSTFEAALASDPDWIFITSWNEWWETTQIEPSETHGDLYLQITREYVDLWKAQNGVNDGQLPALP